METLPREIIRVLRPFEAVFSERVWDWVTVLLVGAILAPGQRTVAAVLRVMGLSDERQFQNYHRVLNRARWSSRELGRRLLVLLVRGLVPADAAGLPHPVTVITRLRLDAALYAPAPPRPPGTKGRPRRKGARQPTLAQRLTDPDTAWQPLTVPWYGGSTAVVEVATGTAVWYHGGLPTVGLRWVLLRAPDGRFEPQALLSTDQAVAPAQIIGWFVRRWQLEVTFHEVRAHLGVETQRQWSDLAILRATPALLGLFSLVTLFAAALLRGQPLPVRQAAWYPKAAPTFADTLALVRQRLWPVTPSFTSPAEPDLVEIQRVLLERLTTTPAFAA